MPDLGLSDVSPRDLFGTNRKSKSILRIFDSQTAERETARPRGRKREGKQNNHKAGKGNCCQLLLPLLADKVEQPLYVLPLPLCPHHPLHPKSWQIKLIDKNVARFLHVGNVRGMPHTQFASSVACFCNLCKIATCKSQFVCARVNDDDSPSISTFSSSSHPQRASWQRGANNMS